MRFKQVVFDFGGVLVDWAPKKIAKMYSSDSKIQRRVLDDILLHQDWLALDQGKCTESEMALRIAARSAFNPPEIQQVFDTVRQSFTPYDEVVVLLNALVSQGIPCYGLSNMSVENYDYLLRTHSFFKLLKGQVISGHENVIKPDLKIFDLLCEHYNLVAGETLFIDDTELNCIAAKQFGLKSFHFRRGNSELAQTLLNCSLFESQT